MPLRSDWSEASCPIARGLDVLGDPWSLLVLRETFEGNNRFDAMRAKLGVADNVLSDRLRRLVEAGLLVRSPYESGRRARSEYRLTEAGADTLPVLHALAAWGDKHTVAPGGPLVVVCRACGRPAGAVDFCAHCGAALRPENVTWLHPSDPGRRIELSGAI